VVAISRPAGAGLGEWLDRWSGKQSILIRDRVSIGAEPVGGEFTTKDTKSAKGKFDGLSNRVITKLNRAPETPDVTFCPPSCSS
jgi:hypothetical protein